MPEDVSPGKKRVDRYEVHAERTDHNRWRSEVWLVGQDGSRQRIAYTQDTSETFFQALVDAQRMLFNIALHYQAVSGDKQAMDAWCEKNNAATQRRLGMERN